jgi:hypothetical protein
MSPRQATARARAPSDDRGERIAEIKRLAAKYGITLHRLADRVEEAQEKAKTTGAEVAKRVLDDAERCTKWAAEFDAAGEFAPLGPQEVQELRETARFLRRCVAPQVRVSRESKGRRGECHRFMAVLAEAFERHYGQPFEPLVERIAALIYDIDEETLSGWVKSARRTGKRLQRRRATP